MSYLYNRAGVSTPTLGTGPVTLGPPIPENTAILQPRWQDFPSAGVVDHAQVRYLIFSGRDWEYGLGTYNAGILTRAPGPFDGTLPGTKSSTGSLISLNGAAQVFICAVSEDILSPGATGISDGAKGDIIVSGGGTIWTINNDSVTYAKIQNVNPNRLLGRITSGTGDVEELTGTQATSLLDIFSTSTSLAGLVPGSNNNTSAFLKGDGTWATPPGGGGSITVDSTPIIGGTIGNILFHKAGTPNVIGEYPNPLPIANGGTATSSYTKGDILVATGATALAKRSVGTDGQVLTADSAQTDGVKWATAAASPIPSGTVMIFVQAAAPTGWTRVTTFDDALPRIVGAGTPGTAGGTNGFSTVMALVNGGGHTLVTTEIPSHNHVSYWYAAASGDGGAPLYWSYYDSTGSSLWNSSANSNDTNNIGFTGGGLSHNHPMTSLTGGKMDIKYVDTLLASKN